MGKQTDSLSSLIAAGIEAQNNAHLWDQTAIEKILVKHSTMLDLMFGALCQTAIKTGNAERYELAMKMQNACRKTLLALHDVRNPKKSATFIKQAIAQQVNQLVTSEQPHKTLEESHATPLDRGTKTAPARPDPDMETLGKVHRRKNTGRKAAIKPECF